MTINMDLAYWKIIKKRLFTKDNGSMMFFVEKVLYITWKLLNWKINSIIMTLISFKTIGVGTTGTLKMENSKA